MYKERIIKGSVDLDYFMYFECSIRNSKTKLTFNKVKCVIDTGAATTFINPYLSLELGLEKIGENIFENPINGNFDSDLFEVDFVFNNYVIKKFKVGNFQHDSYKSGIIIGMDMLRNSNLSFFGKSKTFEFLPMSNNEF